ncbi:hypothetical protein NC651_006414 [Populus alba x Populus x berolinensis]|nr:hypothetical protein NC651_006414 [Populus alba x Populus x berolinensis]
MADTAAMACELRFSLEKETSPLIPSRDFDDRVFQHPCTEELRQSIRSITNRIPVNCHHHPHTRETTKV